jgi:LysR family hydrogen peroxide-inducible transcriptional activator
MNHHPFTLRQLQYIVAVADLRSFRGAAERCHVSQPSLSAQVAQCEDLLGVQIFERTRRRVELTSAGELIVSRARLLLVGADDLVEAARGLADPLVGVVSVGAIPTVAPYLLPEVGPWLRTSLPRIEVRWVEDKTPNLVASLARGELDAAIVALEAELGAVEHVVLGKDPFVFAAAPEHPIFKGRRRVRLEDLEGESVLLLDDGHCFRDQAIAACATAGLTEASYRATSLQTLVQMAAQGSSVTLLPSLAVALENRRGDLQIRQFQGRAPSRTIALVWRKAAARAATYQALGEALALAFQRAIEPDRAVSGARGGG